MHWTVDPVLVAPRGDDIGLHFEFSLPLLLTRHQQHNLNRSMESAAAAPSEKHQIDQD